jgi:hypothetical protein
MKGSIKKTEQGLIVKYHNPRFTGQSIPIHPIDVNLLNDGDEVEFTEVEEWSEYLSLIIKYGKIINHPNSCQFEPKTNTSSATICQYCGREKFLHKK